MDARSINEAELASHLPAFLDQLKLQFIAREVKIGAYRLDAVASDQNGALVVIEFKANASIATLGQLLLYPHALRERLLEQRVSPPPIRAALITTHLDSNVVAVAQALGSHTDISIFVCIGSAPNKLALVAPSEAGGQVWDQSTKGSCKLGPILAHLSNSA